MIELLTYLGCIVLAALTVFQVALILGSPIGRFSWGGNHNVLPLKLRIASASSVFIYLLFAAVLVSKTNVAVVIDSKTFVNIAIWVMAAYFSVGVFLNAVSRSKPERNLMTPAALILALCFLAAAMS